MPNLPLEIITEILSRLPVKSLVRFRCVCKPWRFLISDTNFINKHLHMSSTDDSFKNHSLIFDSVESKLCFMSCSVYSLFHEPYVYAIELDYPLKRRFDTDSIEGSCNGLICIRTRRKTVHLWNPSTKELRDLPPVGRASIKFFVVYGFGYDYSIDDYKVVSVCYPSNFYAESEVKVYTLKIGSWRRIADFPYGALCSAPGKFVGGSLNWEVEYCDNAGCAHPNSSWNIVALDLASESYREMPQPMYEAKVCYQHLGVLGGDLSVICQNSFSHADVWVMKEYGVRESWNKMFRIPIPYLTDVDVDVDVGSFGYCYTPLCYSKNGKLLFEFGSDFFLYSSNDDTFRHPEIRIFDACLYVESLVSLNPEDRIGRNY